MLDDCRTKCGRYELYQSGELDRVIDNQEIAALHRASQSELPLEQLVSVTASINRVANGRRERKADFMGAVDNGNCQGTTRFFSNCANPYR